MQKTIQLAITALSEGKLIGLPTETVYGLAAPINNQQLIGKIFSLKKRPFFDPLIVHVSSIDQAKSLVHFWPPICDELAKSFWPGPVTLVLEKLPLVSDLITSGLTTVGIRIPRSQLARDFISALGVPVAAPSANLFKQISPTSAQHVREVFSSEDVFVLDDGPCDVGIESTIIKVTASSLEILRPGLISAIELEEIADRFNYEIIHSKNTEISAPGMLEEHYRPTKPMYVVAAKDFSQAKKKLILENTHWFQLSNQPELAARELYQKMREACENENSSCSLFINEKNLSNEAWKGIIDRLKKASIQFIK